MGIKIRSYTHHETVCDRCGSAYETSMLSGSAEERQAENEHNDLYGTVEIRTTAAGTLRQPVTTTHVLCRRCLANVSWAASTDSILTANQLEGLGLDPTLRYSTDNGLFEEKDAIGTLLSGPRNDALTRVIRVLDTVGDTLIVPEEDETDKVHNISVQARRNLVRQILGAIRGNEEARS